MKSNHALAFALALLAGTALAQEAPASHAGDRHDNQVQRIKQGVGSGELTGREAHQLAHQQVRIAKTGRRAKSDGDVTRAEHAKLHVMQDRASASIARQKHDRQDRGPD